VDGKGADVPIATNATLEGRAENRRVEVMIGRTSE
jgi:flagellar motor protein MotB